MMSLWATSALWVCGLGMAPLVLGASQALRWELDSLARGQAVLLAQDLSHRLHLNAASARSYQLGWGQQPTSPECRHAPCSRSEWAQADLAAWRGQVAQQLPDGDAWLQASAEAEPTRWLVLAWSSQAGGEAISTPRPPVSCPEGKRCQAWILSP